MGPARQEVSDGAMGGTVAFHSDALWVVAEWDRGEPYLFLTSVCTTACVGWDVRDALLRGRPRFEGPAVPQRAAPPDALAGWLRVHCGGIETRLRPPAREATPARVAAYEAERQADAQRWVNGLRRRLGGAG